MNAPQNPSSSHSDSAPEQADLNQLDDLLADLLSLQDESPVLSPFLASREDRGIPEFELAAEQENSAEIVVEISDDTEILENALTADSEQSELETSEIHELAPEKQEAALSVPTPLNVRLQSKIQDANPQAQSNSFFDSLLENPYSTVLSSTEPSPVKTVSESESKHTESSSYQDIHQALAKQSKSPFLTSPKLWLVLALVGLGAGGGVALWQKFNQPRVAFSLSGQDLGTDFLDPDPLASASSGSSVAPSSPSVGASIASSSVPSASPSAGASLSPSTKPSVEASASTELLLWGRINQASVNIRSAPGKQASVVLQPKINQKFILTGQSKRADDLDWAELQLDESKTAWVSTRFIEISPGEKVAIKASSAPASAKASSQPIEASQDEYAQAAKVVAQLLKAPGTVWPQATPELQNLTVLAMLKQIFKDKPDDVTPQRIATLQSCLDESARAENLKKLKVYEIAVACTLALNWR